MQYFIRLLALLFLTLSVGCAHYEYDLLEPRNLIAHIGKTDKSFDLPPLSYTLRTVDNRLVMRIYNQIGEPVRLLGEESTIVDPDGESHPLPGQTIAPGSYIKLILPPMQPQFQARPTIGIGLGGRFGHAGHLHHPATVNEPQYLRTFEASDTIYWDWKGQTEIRLTLVFEHARDTFKHEFTFKRKKM
jgi:hypothetical protein